MFINKVSTIMPYKVFFVEDEIVTREGIRDNVDWKTYGFEFSGEATDGEMALPLIRSVQPDVLITDIKMPFMDGLQLSKIIHDRMPWVKIVILSGHDEFEYAQKAIEVGVTEYLLKPVTVQHIHQTLQKIGRQLDHERHDLQNQQMLREMIEENQATLKEKLLLKLMVGAVSVSEIIEQGQPLGIDLSAQCYLVVLLKIELEDRTEQYDYSEYQHVRLTVEELIKNNPDVFLFSKDWDELILLIKGNISEYLEKDKERLLSQIRQTIGTTRYHLVTGAGSVQRRMADICLSFVQALASIQNIQAPDHLSPAMIEAELLKVNKTACENFLRSGEKDEIESFLQNYLTPLSASALKSSLLKNYLVVDVVCAAVKLLEELGGEIDQVIPEFNHIETILANITTVEQFKEQIIRIFLATIAFRDSRASSQYHRSIQQAKAFIEEHYAEADLSLSDVASRINLSSSHFSVIFSQVIGRTFKEFLTEHRITKAKELLRSTTLRAVDIARLVGYNDPHYFSSAFKKNTGLSPTEFRARIHPQK
jgi:two-component system, response regulator YesN